MKVELVVSVTHDQGFTNPMFTLELPNGLHLYVDKLQSEMNYRQLHRYLVEALELPELAPAPATDAALQSSGRRFSKPLAPTGNASGEENYGDYRDIEKRIMDALGHKTMAITNRKFLLEDRTIIRERGMKDVYKSPAELYDTDPMFRDYVDQCILWQEQAAQDSSSRISVGNVVKTICNYQRERTGWLDWAKRKIQGGEGIPVSLTPAKVEVVPARPSHG